MDDRWRVGDKKPGNNLRKWREHCSLSTAAHWAAEQLSTAHWAGVPVALICNRYLLLTSAGTVIEQSPQIWAKPPHLSFCVNHSFENVGLNTAASTHPLLCNLFCLWMVFVFVFVKQNQKGRKLAVEVMDLYFYLYVYWFSICICICVCTLISFPPVFVFVKWNHCDGERVGRGGRGSATAAYKRRPPYYTLHILHILHNTYYKLQA